MPYIYSPGNARDLEKNGTWFRDGEGRYATFRGVNFSGTSKLPPYLPFPMSDFENVKPQLDLMRELGFNIVRLLVIWKALEPAPQSQPDTLSSEGRRYLEDLRTIIDALYERGIFVMVNFHQDLAHEIYGGDGFPDWALASDADHPLPPPADFKNPQWALNYQFNSSCRHTLSSFWRNDLLNDQLSPNDQQIARRVRDHFVKTIGAVAGWFQSLNGGAGHPAIIGYGLFNEPHEAELAADDFEKFTLPELYRTATEEIRKAKDARSFVFIQPRVGWTQFTLDPISSLDTNSLEGERVVLAYHHYDTWTISQDFIGLGDSMENKQNEWPLVHYRMRAGAVWRGLIPFITELGANHNWEVHHTDLRPDIYHGSQTRAYMDLEMQQIDRYLQNFTYWNYSLYNTEELKDGWNLENFSLLGPNRQPRHLDIVSRPYAMRSSAEPTHGYFDLGTKHFALRLRGPVVDAPTVLFIPRRLHYRGDFEVRASTKNALEWDDARQLLYWWPDKARHDNLIVVCPFGGFRHDTLPFFAREIMRVVNQAAVRMPSPFGWLDQAVFANNRVEVSGWAIDPETVDPIEVRVQVDNVLAGSGIANTSRPDVGAVYPGYGDNHGFLVRVKAPMGTHRVCVFAINTRTGSDVRLGCRDVFVPLPGPCGVLEAEVATLKSQIASLEAQIRITPIRQRLVLFEALQELRDQLVLKQAELDACIKRELG